MFYYALVNGTRRVTGHLLQKNNKTNVYLEEKEVILRPPVLLPDLRSSPYNCILVYASKEQK